MRTFNVIQGSEDWLALRCGVLTTSRFSDAFSQKETGSVAKGTKRLVYTDSRRRLIEELTAEYLTGDTIDHYETAAMRRGIDMEPEAASVMEARTGMLLEPVGFALHDHLQVGTSLDRMIVGERAHVEFKCPWDLKKTVNIWKNGDISEYIEQVKGQLWITQHKYAILAVYDPRLAKRKMDLWTCKIERDDREDERLCRETEGFLLELSDYKESILRAAP
jgi:hypothetical protein